MNKVNRYKAEIYAISHIVREKLTGKPVSEEFSNFTEFSDKFIRGFTKKKKPYCFN